MAISTLSLRVLAEPLRSLGHASISGAYMGIGTALQYPARLLWVTNLTDALLAFSLDGTNDHFILPSNSNFVFDVTTNQKKEDGLYFAAGTRVYVKEIGMPSSGSVYVSTFYGSTF